MSNKNPSAGHLFLLNFHFQGMFSYSNEDTEEVVMEEGNRNGVSVYVSKEDGTRWVSIITQLKCAFVCVYVHAFASKEDGSR